MARYFLVLFLILCSVSDARWWRRRQRGWSGTHATHYSNHRYRSQPYAYYPRTFSRRYQPALVSNRNLLGGRAVSDSRAFEEFRKFPEAVAENLKRTTGVFYRPGRLISPNGFFYTLQNTCASPAINTVFPGFNDLQPGIVTLRLKPTVSLGGVARELQGLGASRVEFHQKAPCEGERRRSPAEFIEVIVHTRPGDEIRLAGVCGIRLSRQIFSGDIPMCELASPEYFSSMRAAWNTDPSHIQSFRLR